MATLVTQLPTPTGTAPTFAAANAGGDKCEPGDDMHLYVKNGSGAAITVTVASVANCNQGGNHNLVVSIPATTGERLIGPFPAGRYAGTDGLVAITYSGVTTLTIAAIRG